MFEMEFMNSIAYLVTTLLGTLVLNVLPHEFYLTPNGHFKMSAFCPYFNLTRFVCLKLVNGKF